MIMDFLLGFGLLIPLLTINIVLIMLSKTASFNRSLTLVYAMWVIGMFIVITYTSTICILVKPHMITFGIGLMDAIFIYVIAKVIITLKILKDKKIKN